MRDRGLPRALLVVAAVGVAVVAGIGTAGSFGGGGTLWGDRSGEEAGAEEADRDRAVLRAPVIRAAIDSLTAAYQEAVNAGDLEAAAGVYARDAVSSLPGAPAAEGRGAIRRSLERSFPDGASLEITSTEIDVLSPEWAAAWGAAAVDRDGAGGDPATETTFVALFEKTGDGWRVAREAVSASR